MKHFRPKEYSLIFSRDRNVSGIKNLKNEKEHFDITNHRNDVIKHECPG
jgi:hypothetical protein